MKVKDLLQDLESGDRTKEMLNEKSNYRNSMDTLDIIDQITSQQFNPIAGSGLVNAQAFRQILGSQRIGGGLI